MTRTYAGIGSRATPAPILELMELAAEALGMEGWTLRSGHAPGADQHFEVAAPRSEIYLPWAAFERDVLMDAGYVMPHPTDAAYTMAARFHPAWERLSQGARALHARNCHIMLGPALNDPVGFVICWTKDGAATGGTGQALRIAEAQGIEVFNLWKDSHRERVCGLINRHRESEDAERHTPG